MRELVLKMSVSVDALVGGPDGSLQGFFGSDPEAVAWTVETVWNASLHIMGSRTFREMAAYWPASTEVFAPPMNQIPKTVFSKTGPALLETIDTTAALDNARARAKPGETVGLQAGAASWSQAQVARGALAEEIAKLKAEDGKPIVAHGGARFARSLVAQGLVDQFSLLVHPVALGRGLSIFSDLPEARLLKLIESRAFPGGAIAQIYRPR